MTTTTPEPPEPPETPEAATTPETPENATPNAPPKNSLQRTMESTVEGRSPGFLLGSLAIAMVISLLAGLLIGVAIGQDDSPKQTATPVTTVRPKAVTPKPRAQRAKAPLVGTLSRVRPKSLTVRTVNGRTATVSLVPRTLVEETVAGTTKDIVNGSRAIIVIKPATATPTTAKSGSSGAKTATPTLTAAEILVLPAKAPFGTPITAVTAETMSLKAPNGKTVKFRTVGAKVFKTTRQPRTTITQGARVMVQTFRAKKAAKAKRQPPLIALEIVLLPAKAFS